MAQPLFERAEESELPEHIKSETDPDKINKYWQERERQIRSEAAVPPPSPPNQPTTVLIPGGMTPGQASTLVSGAKLLASQGKEHWQRFLPEVEGIMGQMTPEQRMDASMWNTVYDKIVGMHIQDLVKEAREAALRPPSMESSSPATPADKPRQLSVAELHVVDQLRRAGATAVRKDTQGNVSQVPFDEEAYIAADERRQKGAWPLTFNNY